MKKILFVVAILGCVNVSAFAVTKCLNTSVIFNSCSNYSGAGSDFFVTCQGVSVRGVAFCGIGGTTTSQVTTSGTLGNNTNCWCRMISPAVSGIGFMPLILMTRRPVLMDVQGNVQADLRRIPIIFVRTC